MSLLSLMVIKTQPLRGPAAARAAEPVSKPQTFA
jgi:hypothetical protein